MNVFVAFGNFRTVRQRVQPRRQVADEGVRVRRVVGERVGQHLHGLRCRNRHHPVQVGMIHMRRHGEGIGQFQIRIRAGDAEAHQEAVRAVGQHRAVVHGHAGHVVRQRHHRHGEEGGFGAVGDGHHQFAGCVFHVRGGDFDAVQRHVDDGGHVQRLVRRALIDDTVSVGFPRHGFAALGEFFRAADVFQRGQQRPVVDFRQSVAIFKANVVNDGQRVAVGIRHGINTLVFHGFRAGKAG